MGLIAKSGRMLVQTNSLNFEMYMCTSEDVLWGGALRRKHGNLVNIFYCNFCNHLSQRVSKVWGHLTRIRNGNGTETGNSSPAANVVGGALCLGQWMPVVFHVCHEFWWCIQMLMIMSNSAKNSCYSIKKFDEFSTQILFESRANTQHLTMAIRCNVIKTFSPIMFCLP